MIREFPSFFILLYYFALFVFIVADAFARLLFLSFAELGPISKVLNTNSRVKACEKLLARACRDAPTLLNYVPSYMGVLKRRGKRKEGELGVCKKKVTTAAAGAKKGPKQPRVKLSTFRKSAVEWFEPLRSDDVFEPILLGLNVSLQTIDLTDEEMSRRNVPRPVIPTKTTNPARTRGPSDT